MAELSECLLVEEDDLDKETSAGPSSAPEEQPSLLNLLRAQNIYVQVNKVN